MKTKYILRGIINNFLFQFFCIFLIRKNILPKKTKNLVSLKGFNKIYKSDIKIFNNGLDAVSRDLCIFGIPKKEHIIFEKFISEIKNSKSFLDIGAGIGMFSLFAKRINPKIKVWSIEPNPAIFEILKKNLNHNNLHGVNTLNKAIMSESGKIEFYIPAGNDFSYATYNKNILEEKNIPFTSVIVESSDLRLETKLDFDVIKIDVEGAELEVLKGVQEKIRNCKFLFIEIMKENKNDVFMLLKKLSFDVIIDSNEYVGNYVFKNNRLNV